MAPPSGCSSSLGHRRHNAELFPRSHSAYQAQQLPDPFFQPPPVAPCSSPSLPVQKITPSPTFVSYSSPAHAPPHPPSSTPFDLLSTTTVRSPPRQPDPAHYSSTDDNFDENHTPRHPSPTPADRSFASRLSRPYLSALHSILDSPSPPNNIPPSASSIVASVRPCQGFSSTLSSRQKPAIPPRGLRTVRSSITPRPAFPYPPESGTTMPTNKILPSGNNFTPPRDVPAASAMLRPDHCMQHSLTPSETDDLVGLDLGLFGNRFSLEQLTDPGVELGKFGVVRGYRVRDRALKKLGIMGWEKGFGEVERFNRALGVVERERGRRREGMTRAVRGRKEVVGKKEVRSIEGLGELEGDLGSAGLGISGVPSIRQIGTPRSAGSQLGSCLEPVSAAQQHVTSHIAFQDLKEEDTVSPITPTTSPVNDLWRIGAYPTRSDKRRSLPRVVGDSGLRRSNTVGTPSGSDTSKLGSHSSQIGTPGSRRSRPVSAMPNFSPVSLRGGEQNLGAREKMDDVVEATARLLAANAEIKEVKEGERRKIEENENGDNKEKGRKRAWLKAKVLGKKPEAEDKEEERQLFKSLADKEEEKLQGFRAKAEEEVEGRMGGW
ncbi:MAG: hypothetical protein MMC23_000633 [Stictis urceolatum]|nr:hypothetical protein [Stictis urceolata]